MDVARCGWLLSVSLLFAACSQTTTPPPPSTNFIAWSQQAPSLPKQVCVLPFVDHTNTPGLADQVRGSFAGQLSLKRFVDYELYAVDAQLETLGPDWRRRTVQEIGQTLGCEALIYGEMTKASRLYLAVYSQLILEGNIQMIETATGQTLIHEAHATKFRSAGVPFSPLSIISDVVKNLSNLSDAQMTRAIDDLGRHLAMKIPDLPAQPQAPPTPIAHESTPLSAPTDMPELLPAEDRAFPLGASTEQIAQAAPSVYDVPPSTTDDTEQTVFPSALQRSTVATGSPDDEGYRLQIAAFSTEKGAERAVTLLREKGYEPVITASTDTRPAWHRVTLGPFPSIHSAQEVGAEIAKVLPFSPIVIYPPFR